MSLKSSFEDIFAELDVLKLLLGLLKGLVIGAGVGYGAFALGLDGALLWLVYGVVGAVVGLLVGRPFWSLLFDKNATSVVAILKCAFGFGVGVGLYALVSRVWGGFMLPLPMLASGERLVQDWQPVMGGAIGALYGAFVEVDDSVEDPKKVKAKALAAAEKPAEKPAKKA